MKPKEAKLTEDGFRALESIMIGDPVIIKVPKIKTIVYCLDCEKVVFDDELEQYTLVNSSIIGKEHKGHRIKLWHPNIMSDLVQSL